MCNLSKRILWLAGLAFAAFALLLGGRATAGSDVGDKAPDFTLKTHDGKSLTLSKLQGQRGAVLVFFATWCPPCMAEVPHVIKLTEQAKDSPVMVYGVNLQQEEGVVKKFVETAKVNYRVLLDSDGAVAKAYDVVGIPTIVAIDGSGVVRYRDHGLPDDIPGLLKTLSEGTNMKTAATAAEPGLRKTAATEQDYEKDGVRFISKETLTAWKESDKSLVIVDVLGKESYDKAHIAGAVHIPYAEVKDKAATLDKNATVVTYCANYKCHASTAAAQALTELGFAHVYDYKGGIKEWKEAGLPVGP